MYFAEGETCHALQQAPWRLPFPKHPFNMDICRESLEQLGNHSSLETSQKLKGNLCLLMGEGTYNIA
jgi:hypothetical protein